MKSRILFALLLVACCKGPPVSPIPTTETGDASDDLEDAASPCGRACKTLRSLGCPEGAPSPGGVSCYRVCLRAGAMLDPACVAAAANPQGVRACHVRCEQ